jgi:hypothetical protein
MPASAAKLTLIVDFMAALNKSLKSKVAAVREPPSVPR